MFTSELVSTVKMGMRVEGAAVVRVVMEAAGVEMAVQGKDVAMEMVIVGTGAIIVPAVVAKIAMGKKTEGLLVWIGILPARATVTRERNLMARDKILSRIHPR